ncbi:endonuclease VII domain-containing protein [Paractinoplanes rhizophilus]
MEYRDRRYQLTEQRYRELLAVQNGRCPICLRQPGHDPHKGRPDWPWCVDHDHNCCPHKPTPKNPTCGNCTRGLLCTRCNSALGQLADDPQRLERALQYLLETRAQTGVPPAVRVFAGTAGI